MFETKLTEFCQLLETIKSDHPDQIPFLPGFFRNQFNRLNNQPKRDTVHYDLKLIESLGNLEEFNYESISSVINSQVKTSDKVALDEIRECVTLYSEDYSFRRAVTAILNKTSSSYDELLVNTLKLLVDVTESHLGDLQFKDKKKTDPFYRYL